MSSFHKAGLFVATAVAAFGIFYPVSENRLQVLCGAIALAGATTVLAGNSPLSSSEQPNKSNEEEELADEAEEDEPDGVSKEEAAEEEPAAEPQRAPSVKKKKKKPFSLKGGFFDKPKKKASVRFARLQQPRPGATPLSTV